MTAWGKDRRAFLGVCAAALVSTLVGCGGGGGGGGNGGGGSETVVTGFVYNSTNQDEEVEGATVVMGNVSGTTVTRDQASPNNPVGSFRLVNVPVGTTTATITFLNSRQIGDTDQRETFTDTQTVAFFPPVARGSNAGLELFVNIGQILGRVLLPNGQPANGANVFVAPSGLTATADAEGRFLIENVPLEPIEVTAVLGTAAVTKNVTINNGASDIGDLQLVEDPNPNPPGLPPTIRGTARVDSASGGLAAGATVILFRNGAQLEQTIANAQGEYSFYVPVGNYTVRVSLPGYQDANLDLVLSNPNQPAEASVILIAR